MTPELLDAIEHRWQAHGQAWDIPDMELLVAEVRRQAAILTTIGQVCDEALSLQDDGNPDADLISAHTIHVALYGMEPHGLRRSWDEHVESALAVTV